MPDLGLDFESRAGQVLDNHVSQTLKLAAEIKAGTVAPPEPGALARGLLRRRPVPGRRRAYAEIDDAVRGDRRARSWSARS